MADISTDPDRQYLYKDVLNFLGKPSSSALPGAQNLAVGGPPSIAAAPTVGGVAGGTPAEAAGGAAGAAGGKQPSDLLSQISAALGLAGKTAQFGNQLLGAKGDLGTRGGSGDTNQSLSDFLRSGGDLSGIDLSKYVGTPSTYGAAIANEGGAEGLRGLGQMTPGATSGLTELPTGATGVGELPGVSIPTGEVGAATGAAGSLGSNINLGAGGAGVVAALLGLLAQETGSKDLAEAAKATGAAASAAGLVGSGASLAASGATIGSEIGAEAAGLGAGAGAGLAFAPITAMMLASMISGLAGGEDPVGEGMSEMMAGSPKYQSFVGSKLMPAEKQQSIGLQQLQDALPYVQSKEELGQLLNSYKNYVTTTSGAPLTGGPDDIYSIQTIPGTGPVTHGMQTPSNDWSSQTAALQSKIDQLLGTLPGDKITQSYAQGGGIQPGEVYNRLWQQFNPEQFAIQASNFQTPGGVYAGAGSPLETFSEQDMSNAFNSGVINRAPVWDPSTGQFVYTWQGGPAPQKPSDYFKVSPYWQQLQNPKTAQAAPAAAPDLSAAIASLLQPAPVAGTVPQGAALTSDELMRKALLGG